MDPSFAERCVVCTAPSKTFNIAGLQIANIVIPNEELRGRYRKVLERIGYFEASPFSLEACRSCYTHGGPWLDELKDYLAQNLSFFKGLPARTDA